MDKYNLGDKVCFVDENQCEIRGIIYDKHTYPDRLVLRIELEDNSGFYHAILMRN